ncbi:MAG: hypothetical protein M5R36_23385 [Deltaproteobacteria bacterium]|nr:hypothetical protein [Deltaproteobacteria bacterium]
MVLNRDRSHLFFVLALTLCFAFSLSCTCGDDDDDDDDDDVGDDDTSADDDDDDTGGDDDIDDDDDDTDDDESWDNLSDPLGEGEVRAGIIASGDELIGGPRARGEIGDYKIYNSRVEFIIRSTELPGISWSTYSGNIIDADRARPPAEAGQDALWALEQFLTIPRTFRATSMEIVENGRDGVATIRVHGTDAGLHVVDAILPTWDHRIDITNEYTLEPDKDYLHIRTTITNEANKDRDILIADLPLWGDHLKLFAPRGGYTEGEAAPFANLRWLGGSATRIRTFPTPWRPRRRTGSSIPRIWKATSFPSSRVFSRCPRSGKTASTGCSSSVTATVPCSPR